MFSRLMIAVATTVLMIVTSCVFPAVSLSKSAIAQVPGVYPFKLGDFTARTKAPIIKPTN